MGSSKPTPADVYDDQLFLPSGPPSRHAGIDGIPEMTKIQPSRQSVPVRPSPEVKSETLFGGAREVRIHHAGEVYRLQLTSAGKLLLTK
jgi:hemin uptake protein HemP